MTWVSVSEMVVVVVLVTVEIEVAVVVILLVVVGVTVEVILDVIVPVGSVVQIVVVVEGVESPKQEQAVEMRLSASKARHDGVGEETPGSVDPEVVVFNVPAGET